LASKREESLQLLEFSRVEMECGFQAAGLYLGHWRARITQQILRSLHPEEQLPLKL
jgi:hypothetical protein